MTELINIKKLGNSKIKLLNRIGITNSLDLVFHFPFRYDEIKKSDLNNLEDNERIIVDGKIETIPTIFRFNKKQDKMTFKINEQTKLFDVVIYNRGFLKPNLKLGTYITVIGKLDKKHNRITATDIKFGRLIKDYIEPIYHSTFGLSSKFINNAIKEVIDTLEVEDYIPSTLVDKYNFLNKKESIKIIHNPSDINILKKASLRLKYEELFLFMLKMNYLKNNKNKIGLKRSVDFNEVSKLIDSLPFSLTSDQLSSIRDIYDDLTSHYRMNRLLQGDVGSGKTIVAIISMYINYLSGYQSALMVPTEILATQHFNNIKKIFENHNVNVCLLTGKLKVKEKNEIYKKISSGESDFIIGTHALISENVVYKNLGLVITDEQHRFGVNQRSNLKNKGLTPDILYMSATPIPRTYALTLYGDMDVSSIKSLPNGKKEIITTLKKEKEIKDVLDSMYIELKKNHQIYVVAPLIEESDKIDLENVLKLEEKMNKAFGSIYNIGVLHGKMSNKEKEEVMDKFKKNEINILISTTVIEVGVDVENATMMVIFDAFRFGLSALHQLRGRVGRNNIQSYCILVSNRETERLNILTLTNDGFKISEEDFLLRGSGDLFGFKQSGDMVFKIADLKKDYNILLKAKEDSEEYLKGNIDLKLQNFLECTIDSI